MTWKNVSLVFFREVRDQLRDRRTLFMVAVLPIFLYPMLAMVMMKMTLSFEEQSRKVLLVNTNELPEVPLLDESGNRFQRHYFRISTDADKLQVVQDGVLKQDDSAKDAKLRGFLVEVENRMPQISRLGIIDGQLKDVGLRITALDGAEDVEQEARSRQQQLENEEKALQHELGEWFATAPCDVLIVLPQGFREAIQAKATAGTSSANLETVHPIVLHNSADEKSKIAYDRVRDALRGWERVILAHRLEQAGLPASLPYPVDARSVDLAQPDELAANVWSKIFPTLLVIMAVTGAFYPAIDLGAGEKERGTMETLLISPASRTEIVLGKFFTVMLFSMSTALLNLLSMGFTGKHMLTVIGRTGSNPIDQVAFPPWMSLVWVVVLAVPIAALFSALSLAFAMFARSSKEGQYYLTPMLMVTMLLTMVCLSPAVELTAYRSVLPVVGPTLLLKSLLLSGPGSGILWKYGLTVLVASVVYSLLALWWAIELFQREDILFREAEKFDLGLWVRYLLREKEPTPSFSEAAVCFLLIAMVQFGFLTSMQGSISSDPADQLKLQTVYLISTVGVPPVLMAILLTTNVFKTLKIKWPGWKLLLAGLILPVAIEPIMLEIMSKLDWFFPPLPAGAEKLMQAMATNEVPLWLALAAFAVAPAICEELAFRGFIFTGFQRSRHKWLPVVASGILFGVIHLIDKQIFNAAILGMVIGLLALRSGSLLPGILFHFIFNGLQVVAARIPAEDFESDLGRWLFHYEVIEGVPNLRSTLPTLAMCGLVSALIIGWLISMEDRESKHTSDQISPTAEQPANHLASTSA